MDVRSIETRIQQLMPEASIQVHSDDNVHFVARIVSEQFAGKSRLARHRLVHSALGETLGREIHALSMDLKSPDEAASSGTG